MKEQGGDGKSFIGEMVAGEMGQQFPELKTNIAALDEFARNRSASERELLSALGLQSLLIYSLWFENPKRVKRIGEMFGIPAQNVISVVNTIASEHEKEVEEYLNLVESMRDGRHVRLNRKKNVRDSESLEAKKTEGKKNKISKSEKANNSKDNSVRNIHKLENNLMVQNLKAGDPEAFTKFWLKYFPRIFEYCERRVKNRSEADDLTQEIFIKVWQFLPRFEIRGIPPSHLLYVFARNECSSYLRRVSSTSSLDKAEKEHAPGKDTPEVASIARVVYEDTFRKIESLPSRQRLAIYYRFLEGLSLKEAAKKMDTNDNNVKVLVHKAKKGLRNSSD